MPYLVSPCYQKLRTLLATKRLLVDKCYRGIHQRKRKQRQKNQQRCKKYFLKHFFKQVNRKLTYQNPLRYRKSINNQLCGIKHAINVVVKLVIILSNKTFFLPRVSAKKPHRYELDTTPKKLIADRRDFWSSVKSKSHWAAGIMNIMPIVSMITTIKHKPAEKRTAILKNPYPEKKNRRIN